MKRSTAVLLVCLRLAIGWHFLVEGWQKVRGTDLVGPAETSKPFSSEGYFREGQGPLGRLMRWEMGDPDEEALARLTVRPLPADKDPAQFPAHNRVPPALDADWRDYLRRFTAHYQLDPGQQQLAQSKVEQAEELVVTWLTSGEGKVTRTFPSGTVERTQDTAGRVAEYRARVQELRDTYDKKLPAFGRDVEKARLQKLKAEVAQLRAGLLADLGVRTAELHKTLDDLLTDEQRQRGPVPEDGGEPSGFTRNVRLAVRGYWAHRDDAEAAARPVTGVEVVNFLTRWTLLAVGAGLLLGLFTRLWCVVGAGFLLMTYLTAPPFPWWPAPPQTEGTYLFVNKNVIEMLALLVLATTASGRWFGLDALLHGIFTGFRAEAPAAEREPARV